MIEGRKTFDITLRWPPAAARATSRRSSTSRSTSRNNAVTPERLPSLPRLPLGWTAAPGLSPTGLSDYDAGSDGQRQCGTLNNLDGHAATPPGRPGHAARRAMASPIRRGTFIRPGASTIYREQGNRLIADQVQRPRPRPGQRRGRGPDDDRGPVQGALPRRMERRIPGNGRSRTPLDDDHSALAGPDLRAALPGVPFACWTRWWSSANVVALSLGGIWALLLTRHQLQHLGGRRVHLDLRRGHHGRAAC